MIHVELDIFSGTPNPRWQLSAKDAQTLFDRIIASRTLIRPVSIVESKLGYRGFIITASGTNAEKFQGAGIPPVFRVGDTSNNLQTPTWLLDTTHLLDADLYDYVQDEQRHVSDETANMSEDAVLEETDREIAPSHPAITGYGMNCVSNWFTSSTNFDFWNADTYHRLNNNCYNYAANYRTDTFAQPGRRSGQTFTSFSCSNVGSAVLRDGWSNSCRTSNNLSIYLVIWPGQDFHFYRLCSNGRWCHKPGQTPATNRDQSGNYISDPRTCNRGNYTDACSSGYYYATNGIAVS